MPILNDSETATYREFMPVKDLKPCQGLISPKNKALFFYVIFFFWGGGRLGYGGVRARSP